MGTKGKPTTSTLIETWDLLTLKSIYLTRSTWKILWVLLRIIYHVTNPLVFARSGKAQLLTEKTCFSQNFFCWAVFLSVMMYTKVPDRVSMFVIGHCPLQINLVPCLCKGFSISATTESIIDFLELFRTFNNWGLCFPLRGLLFGFWVVTVKSCFISCYDPWGEVFDFLISPGTGGTQTDAVASVC